MKDPLNRTKVVIRHLPPSLSQSAFFDQIDSRFSGRYGWSAFRPGKTSYKDQIYARAYVNFNSPEDVFEFAEFFNGHVFVNEKGAQFKAIVEYAPSQRIPKQSSKKDGREGTILKEDLEYMEFLERISKPVENLPSADVQLERKEAERAGVQESLIVTPLMEFVRKKRAAKTGSQVLSDGKIGGRVRTSSLSKSRSVKQSSEKKRYILKASGKSANGKDKSTYILLPRRDDQVAASDGKKLSDNEGSVSGDVGKKKILLLKGKELEISQMSGGVSEKKASALPPENSSAPSALKLNHRHDASGKIIRSILLKGQSSSSQSEQKVQVLSSEKGRRPPRPSNIKSGTANSDQSPVNYSIKKRPGDEKSVGNDQPVLVTHEKQERRSRNKERSESGIWAPRRSDASHGDERASQAFAHEVNHREPKGEVHLGSRGEGSSPAGVHNNTYMETGSHKHYGRRNSSHTRDDGSPNEVKSSKRGAAGHGAHEKQVWVQKSASGT